MKELMIWATVSFRSAYIFISNNILHYYGAATIIVSFFIFLNYFILKLLINNIVLVLVYSKISQLCIYVYLFFFKLFSYLGYYRVVNREFHVLHSRSLVVIYFK